jgi:hypothetical protein
MQLGPVMPREARNLHNEVRAALQGSNRRATHRVPELLRPGVRTALRHSGSNLGDTSVAPK